VLASWPGWLWAAPQIGYAYPAGGQRGTTFTVEVGGQYLGGVDGVRVSGAGVRATVSEYARSFENDEIRDTERFLYTLVSRRWSARAMDELFKDMEEPPLPDHPWLRGLDDMTPNDVNQLRTRLFDPKKQPNAQIDEQVVIEVTIDPDAAPGDREFRLLAPDAASNPICFQVGMLPEIRERDAAGGPAGQIVDPPVLVNGQIMPGEIDHIRVRAKKGQKLVIHLQARRLIPYLADAVPGWFQATMSLRNSKGREVAWCDDFRFDPDPLILYEVPENDVYDIEIRDAIYRGRNDFVYRIAIGELPIVTSVFPLGGRIGSPVTAALEGWNLGMPALDLDTGGTGPEYREALVGAERGLCCEVRYAVDTLPEITEAEPNNTADSAQRVDFPGTVNGRIEDTEDVDVFRFDGKAGQSIVAEVLARRLDSPLDSLLRLVGSDGTEIALNDDYKDREMGLITHQADSRIVVQLPRDDTYLLFLSDAQRRGSNAHGYRLRIAPSGPDFALRLVPSVINLSGWNPGRFTVHVLRKDGFAGEVELELVDAPVGFTLGNTLIPADKDSIESTLTVPRGTPRLAVAIRMKGRATIGEKQVSRPVVPAEDMMQAFLWRFLVPRQELLVCVQGSWPIPAVWRPLVSGIALTTDTPVRIPLGGTTRVRVEASEVLSGDRALAFSAIQFHLANRPRGVTLQEAEVGATSAILTLKADRNIALVGDTANVIIEASTEPASGGGTDTSAEIINRASLGVLPPIAYEVVQQ